MEGEKLSKQESKDIKQIEQDAVPCLNRYKEQLATMGDRNSYSKTDPEATFMRMKEDAMLNGQLKPGYNVERSTENQFITNFGIYKRPDDTLTLIDYLESFRRRYGLQSDEIVADSGYGSEENYEYMFRNGASGYRQTISIYRATRCDGCPIRGQCHKSKRNRQIEVNHTLDDYKARARELLTSDQGLKHRNNRPIEPEAVFGQIKECGKFRRLRLKGLTGAKIDFGLKALAHNLRELVLAWAKSSFLSEFLAPNTINWLDIKPYLSDSTKYSREVIKAA